MKNRKRCCRILVLALFMVSAIAGLLPGIGVAGEDMGQPHPSAWVETPNAIARTLAGECQEIVGDKCLEECITINGQLVPQDVYICESQL